VQHIHHTATGFRHILLLALLGFGVVFLSGPVIALASIVLSVVVTVAAIVLVFALIGFLVWAPVYMIYAGREAAGERIAHMGRAVGGTLRRLALIGGRTAAWPVGVASRLFRGGLYATKVTGRFVAEVVIIGLTGAVLGAALGLGLSLMNHQSPAHLVPLNALVGGGIAASVGAVLALLPRRSPQRRGLTA
jgi:hypothetical protein